MPHDDIPNMFGRGLESDASSRIYNFFVLVCNIFVGWHAILCVSFCYNSVLPCVLFFAF